MLVLIVLLVSWLVFRAVGAAGVHALASWQDSARYALVVMFVFTATAHFNKMKHDLAANDSGVLPAFPAARSRHGRFGTSRSGEFGAPAIS
jgi:hypothetical protein